MMEVSLSLAEQQIKTKKILLCTCSMGDVFRIQSELKSTVIHSQNEDNNSAQTVAESSVVAGGKGSSFTTLKGKNKR